MIIEISTQPKEDELNMISEGIRSFNAPFLPNDAEYESSGRFVITAKNDKGEFIGGAQANVMWSYCVLELLWLSEECRGKGVGTSLIKQLESFAIEKGLTQIRTETLSFQAKPFYEKNGFRVYGELHDTPKGHSTYFLVKDL
ncbi:GNAT family N-acetyltransferase [Vibrio sagamiensis]|uniref:N-acetyltransferase n=1 Tax=Vibrio sagamiensis NBRC 104589 TaxID=1219064 RepID=A0A511QCM4_9VIBR|nr:GNAT family N-acetyltransferase [Vibrio sagamiensis]PNQ53625.1 N-acetyltransferase [Vibrio agarivorans]GEM75041.1 N-acetyltransferase [Vibrio sagamiensis NBRC 104589]